ncbi:MAG TPA: DMT family transporter, partial [Tissierellaceae bacterium]|nr:DMT family transporter [Tissierellaceae bacterium]
MDKKHKMILAGISKSIIFGLSIMFIKIAMEKISIFSLLAVRFTLAALIMIVMYLLKIIELNYKGKNIVNLIALSLLFPVLYFAFETLGLKYTASTRAAIIIALNPVVVAILSTLILKEKPNNAEIIFILISTFGVIFIALMSGNSMGRSNIIGIISLFIAVVSLAFYIIFSRMLSKEFTPTEITFSMM